MIDSLTLWKVVAQLLLLILWPFAFFASLMAFSSLARDGWRFSLRRLFVAMTLFSLALGLTLYAFKK